MLLLPTGVANAQSAYFSFAQFLSWSDQPIYVLDKDNDLSIAQLVSDGFVVVVLCYCCRRMIVF